MDPISERNLAGLCPEFVRRIRLAAEKAAGNGLYFRVYSGLRSAAEQNALYAKGRTAAGPIVTNAKAGQSMHNYGLAADIVPFMAGQSGALNWTTESAQYRTMVGYLKAEGLEWGGDWIHFQDFDHFQLGGIPANPSALMIADYGGGEHLDTVWQKATAGDYA